MSNYWANDAHREMLRTKYRHYAMWGLDIFDRMAFLWGNSAVNAPGLAGRIARLRTPLEDWLRNRIRLPAYYVGHDDLRDHLRRIAAFRPAAIYAYSKSAYLLALEAEAMNFHCASLRLIILAAEAASPHMISKVEQSFGVPAIVEYGSVESGVIAGEWPDRTLRVHEDVALVETLPRDDGRFDIVLTVLTNPSFPLIRYSIGDITDAPLEIPARGHAILKNIAGRDMDLIISRSGRCIHGLRFEHALQVHRAIRRFRVHQGADGALSALVEVDDSSASLDMASLEQKLTDLVEGYPVKLEVVDALPQTASGKHRTVISDLVDESLLIGTDVLKTAKPMSPGSASRPKDVK